MTRSPALLISHTVPSGSTRPCRYGSLAGAAGATWWCADGTGPGRGPGRGGPGRGAGLGVVVVDCEVASLPPCSLVVIFGSSYPPRGHLRAPAARRGAI